jgi:hypothetical protein
MGREEEEGGEEKGEGEKEFFVFAFETGSCYVAQTVPEFLSSNDPLVQPL